MRHFIAPVILVLLGQSLLAQSTPIIDPKAMLEGLQLIKQKQEDASKHALAQTIADFSAACSDDGAALNFYLEAEQVTRFAGSDGGDGAFEAWKKNVIPRLKPSAIRTALRYTTISLQRAAGGTDDQIFPVLYQYAIETQEVLPSLLTQDGSGAADSNDTLPQDQGQEGRGRRGYGQRGFGGGPPPGFGGGMDPGERIMEEPVSSNIFSRWYNLSSQLGALSNWEGVPANIDNMYTDFLLPYMRTHRDSRILNYWDDRIIIERGAASGATAAFSTDRYNLTVRPALLWKRAEDEIVIGRRDQGLSDMYGLVKAFPAHPDASKWITELESLLSPPPAAPVASGGGAPIPVAPQ